MSWQRSFWFRVPLIKQLKRDNAGHGELTINNAATVTFPTTSLQNGIILICVSVNSVWICVQA